MTALGTQFKRFAIVGVFGFLVDVALLHAAMEWLGLGPYGGRCLSFLGAATFTWAANRAYSFRDAPAESRLVQWLRFLVANAAGAAVNFGVYIVIVALTGPGASWPVIGVAAGSIAGLAFNFTASRRWVFR